MTKMNRLTLAAGLLAGTALAPAALAQEAWTIDNSHTHILFMVDHFGMSTIHGEFEDFTGELIIDRDTPENSSVVIAIDPASLDTGWADRDAHFTGADFFDVEAFPEVAFVSTGITMTGQSTMDIAGDLTIKGITHPVVLAAQLNGVMDDHPLIDGTQPLAGFSATTTVLRSDYGMDLFTPFVADEVTIEIEMEVIGPTAEG